MIRLGPSALAGRLRAARAFAHRERLPAREGIRFSPVRRAFGLDISDASIEGVELARVRRARFTLRAYNRILLPKGVVVGGEIVQSDALQEALRSLLASARPNAFSRAAVVALPELKVYLHTFAFPMSLREEQMRHAIPFEVQGVLPVDILSMETDVAFHGSRDGTRQHALFAAVPRTLVEAYRALLRSVGIEPVAFDLESAALARSLVGFRLEPTMIVDIGALRTTLSVVERAIVHGAVNIPVGGDKLTEAIMRTEGVPLETAQYEKAVLGVTSRAHPATRSVLEEQLQPMVREMRQMLRTHEESTGRAVRTIVLAGGTALLPGLPDIVADITGCAVALGDPLETIAVAFPASLRAEDATWLRGGRAFFATSIGLAIRGAHGDAARGGMNLLPSAARRRYLLWRENLAVSTLALMFVSVLTPLFLFMALDVVDAGFTSRRIQVQVESVRTLLASQRTAAAAADVEGANQEIDVLAAFRSGMVDPLPTLKRLRAAVPPGVRLVGAAVTAPSGSPGVLSVQLRGLADTRDHFLVFEQNARALPGVQRVDSPLTNLDRPADVPFFLDVTFAGMTGSPGAQPEVSGP